MRPYGNARPRKRRVAHFLWPASCTEVCSQTLLLYSHQSSHVSRPITPDGAQRRKHTQTHRKLSPANFSAPLHPWRHTHATALTTSTMGCQRQLIQHQGEKQQSRAFDKHCRKVAWPVFRRPLLAEVSVRRYSYTIHNAVECQQESIWPLVDNKKLSLN